jgi:hypothetical protein
MTSNQEELGNILLGLDDEDYDKAAWLGLPASVRCDRVEKARPELYPATLGLRTTIHPGYGARESNRQFRCGGAHH